MKLCATFQIYDYLEIVDKPMDFDQMLNKLDNCEYQCAQDFLDDIDLIADNALKYNSDLNYETNRIICHRAKELTDHAYALVKAEMDTDFEDECKAIVERRKKLTHKLKKAPEARVFDPNTGKILTATEAEAASTTINAINGHQQQVAARKKRAIRRRASWASGVIKKAKKKTPTKVNNAEEEEEDMENANENGEQDEAEAEAEADDHDEVMLSDDNNANASHNNSADAKKEFKIDAKRMKSVEDDLVKRTAGFTAEPLERIFVRLMKLVTSYKTKFDRSQLPRELQDCYKSTIM